MTTTTKIKKQNNEFNPYESKKTFFHSPYEIFYEGRKPSPDRKDPKTTICPKSGQLRRL